MSTNISFISQNVRSLRNQTQTINENTTILLMGKQNSVISFLQETRLHIFYIMG